MKKIKVLICIILSSLILSACSYEPVKLTTGTSNQSEETGMDIIPVENQYYKKAAEAWHVIEEENYSDGIISYRFANKSPFPLQYGKLFLIDRFTEDDEWVDTKISHGIRGKMMYGEKIEDISITVSPDESYDEKIDISQYLGRMKAGTYRISKYLLDDTDKKMHHLKIQFVKNEDGKIEDVHGFIEKFSLVGNPLKDLIPEPKPVPVPVPVESEIPEPTDTEEAEVETGELDDDTTENTETTETP